MSALTVATDLLDGLLQLIYPTHCLQCGVMGTVWLCSDCIATLIVPIPSPYCIRCGSIQLDNACSRCVDYPEKFIRCRAVSIHQDALADLIHQFKYRDKPMLALGLATLVSEYLEVRSEIFNDLRFDAIIPIPLHAARQRQRGYNQSERLAKAVAESLGLIVDSNALTRVKNTRQQVGMVRTGRLRNLEGAFRADPAQCSNRTFLLLDDVTTTGSTLRECAQALIDAGASKVYGIALAAG